MAARLVPAMMRERGGEISCQRLVQLERGGAWAINADSPWRVLGTVAPTKQVREGFHVSVIGWDDIYGRSGIAKTKADAIVAMFGVNGMTVADDDAANPGLF